jgi:glycosyltransferase involved in cell wall biosynthesis
LRELIRHLPDHTCDMLVPARESTMDDAAIRAYFGPNLGTLTRFWLPFELCYKGRPSRVRVGHLWAAYAVMWRLSRDKFFKLARGYDLIHLNSIVLHPVVREDLPCIVHVREIVDRDLPAVTRALQRARGVIYIDEAARAPFRHVRPAHEIVLNNPVDMTGVDKPPADASIRLGGPLERLTIFAIIGALIPEKGVDRVVRAFRAVRDPDARLLVVGEGDQEPALRALARGDDRIVLWGQTSDVDAIFALADYVLRGEAYPCVGRTIYEALYAGCGVVIPGGERDNTLFEYDRFATRVRFYPPADEAALQRCFESLVGHKLTNKHGESNAAAYAAEFESFVSAST